MTAVIVSSDLLISSRIESAARAAGRQTIRIDGPADLPQPLPGMVVLVDWDARDISWGRQLAEWRARGTGHEARMILFGPHTDLAAHAAARQAGLGPMWARSKLLAELPLLIRASEPRADSR